MLIHALLSRSTGHAVQPLAETHTFAQVSTRERDYDGTLNELAALSHMTPHVLLVAIDAGPPDALLAGLRQYRVRQPDVRIILLAPGYQPGDPVISALVGLSVYDILPEEGAALAPAIGQALDRPQASYAQAVRWHHPSVQPTQAEASADTPREREILRVMAARDRPMLIAVTGAARASGSTTLSLALSEELAHRGLAVVLLADLPPVEAAALANSFDQGLSLAIRPHETTATQASGRHPTDRLALAFEVAGEADLVVVDLGNLRQAADTDAQTLAIADQLVITWPLVTPRLLEATSSLLTLAADSDRINRVVRQALSKGVHVPYLCPVRETAAAQDLVQSALAGLLPTAALPRHVIPTPLGPSRLDLEPLLTYLAPPPTGRRGRIGGLSGRSLASALRRESGLNPSVPAVSSLGGLVTGGLRLLPWLLFLTVGWLFTGWLHLAGVSLPQWLRADVAATLLN